MNENNQRHIVVSKFEMWIARLMILAILGVTGWFVKDYHYNRVKQGEVIAAVKQELNDTKPKDILEALNNNTAALRDMISDVDKKVLTKDDIKSIVFESSPWAKDNPEWHTWKLEIEKRTLVLEKDHEVMRRDIMKLKGE